jgi:hypothetical protein
MTATSHLGGSPTEKQNLSAASRREPPDPTDPLNTAPHRSERLQWRTVLWQLLTQTELSKFPSDHLVDVLLGQLEVA